MSGGRPAPPGGAAVHGALVLVQLMFASLAIVGRVVLPQFPASALVASRVAGAALVLAAVNALRGGPWVRDRGDLRRLFWLGTLGITLNQSLFVFGLKYTTAVNATILVTLVPVFTVLGSVLTRREPASPLKLAGIAVAGLGALWLIGPGRLTLGAETALGNLLIVAGMACYAAYFIYSKSVLARHDSLTVVTYVMLFAAVTILPLGWLGLTQLPPGGVPARVWALVAYIVAFPTIGTYLLNIWALRRVSSHLVSVYIYLQPLVTAAVAPLVLAGEGLTPRAAAAGLLIFAGLGAVIQAERLQRREVPLEAVPSE